MVKLKVIYVNEVILIALATYVHCIEFATYVE